jgi:NTE family protein
MSKGVDGNLSSPVRAIASDAQRSPRDGLALCLSGGGYRAMLFHLGVLWRLNETRQLARLDQVSSVSGGSIIAGVLAMNWSAMEFIDEVAANFVVKCAAPVRQMASTSVDFRAGLTGILLPEVSISNEVTKAYRHHLYGDTSLQNLPDHPEFIFNATNLESGALLRFGKRYLADYRVGRIEHPDLPIATAVAASSAFPPFLSPATLNLQDQHWITDPGNDLVTDEFRGQIRVSDGGVYDNLGLETAWKKYTSILVSDGGGHMRADPTPPTDWAVQMKRVLDVVNNQVRDLRKRQVIESFINNSRRGMYVGIRGHIGDYPTRKLGAAADRTTELAALPTRLDALADDAQERLINWGYIMCDAGLRSHYLAEELADIDATPLPYPAQSLA